MAREVQVIAWCDNDGEGGRHPDDEQTPAATEDAIVVLLPGRFTVPKLVDLCQECRDNITLKRAWELAEEVGQNPEDTRRPFSKSTRASSVGVGKIPTRELIERAERGIRQGKIPEMDRDQPCLLCVLDYASDSGLRRHYTIGHDIPKDMTSWHDVYGDNCPLCGGRFGQIGGHTAKVHGCLTPMAFKRAEEMNDPYGVVAARREYVNKYLVTGLGHPEPPRGNKPGTKPGVNPRTMKKAEGRKPSGGGPRPAVKKETLPAARRPTSKKSSPAHRH